MIRLTEMLRILYLSLAALQIAFGQKGLDDPAFDKVPFDQWLNGGDDSHIRCSLLISPERLTPQQRMGVRISARIDGTEFVKRSRPGEVVVFLEIRDRDGRVFQTHRDMTLPEMKNVSDLAYASFDQSAFVSPGEYEVAAAVYDTESKEHSLKRSKLRIRGPAHDPLPESWQTVPAVEFVGQGEPPDSWYLPEITSRLNLPVHTAQPVRIEVIVNESPTEIAASRVGRTMRRNMSNLIPALKVISQMDIRNGSLNVTMLDLERRKASFTQDHVGILNWFKLRDALAENDPNQIDVHALENHEQNAQFFVSEIKKRLERDSGTARVLIVLSGPMAFSKGQDLTPIEAAPEPGTRVFYVRFYPPPMGGQAGSVPDGMRPRGRVPPPPNVLSPARGATTEDSLARTLKPLSPKVLDVSNPLEFRTALAAIITGISQGK